MPLVEGCTLQRQPQAALLLSQPDNGLLPQQGKVPGGHLIGKGPSLVAVSSAAGRGCALVSAASPGKKSSKAGLCQLSPGGSGGSAPGILQRKRPRSQQHPGSTQKGPWAPACHTCRIIQGLATCPRHQHYPAEA